MRSRTGNGANVRALSCPRVSFRNAVTSASLEMAAGMTRSTPGERAPLLPLTLSHATARKSG
jgi:hypothetical protein